MVNHLTKIVKCSTSVGSIIAAEGFLCFFSPSFFVYTLPKIWILQYFNCILDVWMFLNDKFQLIYCHDLHLNLYLQMVLFEAQQIPYLMVQLATLRHKYQHCMYLFFILLLFWNSSFMRRNISIMLSYISEWKISYKLIYLYMWGVV